MIESLPDSVSVAEAKRLLLKHCNSSSLETYYRQRFGGAKGGAADSGAAASRTYPATDEPGEDEPARSPTRGALPVASSFDEAQRNCMHSVAAYAIVQYVLQLKDRHNGNILIDASGRMVHIDFAFMLGWAPGGITFEKCVLATHRPQPRPPAIISPCPRRLIAVRRWCTPSSAAQASIQAHEGYG